MNAHTHAPIPKFYINTKNQCSSWKAIEIPYFLTVVKPSALILRRMYILAIKNREKNQDTKLVHWNWSVIMTRYRC